MIILINGSMSYECIRPMTNRSDTLPTTNKACCIKIREETCYSMTILSVSIISVYMTNTKSAKTV